MRYLRFLVVAVSFTCSIGVGSDVVHAGEANNEPADVRRPPAITASDVPAVPAEFFERLRQYQNVRTAGFQGWSADGKGMLIATRFGNSLRVDGEPLALADAAIVGEGLALPLDPALFGGALPPAGAHQIEVVAAPANPAMMKP